MIPADKCAYLLAKQRWDSIAKPLGSFGGFEDIVCKIAAVQRTEDPDISRRTAVIFCGDHGCTEENITQSPQEITAVCAKEIAEGRSNINALADACRTSVIAVDIGMRYDADSECIISRKISRGTKNFTKGAAMTRDETVRAITAGMDIVRELSGKGVKLIVSGEMGIGNTASAAAIASVLLGLPAEKVTGRGAGLSSEGLERKISAVKRAIEINSPPHDDPLAVLSALGGFEIAGMTGLFLGGAYYGIPVIIDGVISAAAAAIAFLFAPSCGDYMLASHCSGEPASAGLLKFIGLRAVIDAGLRLGEGTGGILLVPLIDEALALYNNAHRFEELPMERYVDLK